MSKGDIWKKVVNNYLIFIGIMILVIYTCIVQPTFLSGNNLLSLMRSFVPLAFVSLGMTLIIIGGYIDLSVSGIFSLMSIIGCMLYNRFGGWSMIMIIALGGLCGMLTAWVLVRCGARDDSDALFITFGMQTVFSALALIANGGLAVTLEQTGFTRFIGTGNIVNIPIIMILLVVVAAVLHFMMQKTPMGRSIYLAGGNPVAAELCGIKVSKIIYITYTLTGILTALGAYILLCRVGNAIPMVGKNYETNAIMAVTIGGTSLAGGKGGILNTILGVALVTIMSNSLNLLGINANMQSVWKGVILIAAIWIDSRRTV